MVYMGVEVMVCSRIYNDGVKVNVWFVVEYSDGVKANAITSVPH
jgi:hypothetical protein